jgi:hypothetical protein
VYGLALRLMKSPEMAQDLTQEIFVKVWVKREQLSGIQQFRPWLNTISKNLRCGGSAAYKFLKKSSWLRYHVNDIFNNNKGISRSTTATSMETREVNALQRYMMISLQYFFGKMSGQQAAIQAVTL